MHHEQDFWCAVKMHPAYKSWGQAITKRMFKNVLMLIKARLGFTVHMMLWKSIIQGSQKSKHLIVENAKSIHINSGFPSEMTEDLTMFSDLPTSIAISIVSCPWLPPICHKNTLLMHTLFILVSDPVTYFLLNCMLLFYSFWGWRRVTTCPRQHLTSFSLITDEFSPVMQSMTSAAKEMESLLHCKSWWVYLFSCHNQCTIIWLAAFYY